MSNFGNQNRSHRNAKGEGVEHPIDQLLSDQGRSRVFDTQSLREIDLTDLGSSVHDFGNEELNRYFRERSSSPKVSASVRLEYICLKLTDLALKFGEIAPDRNSSWNEVLELDTDKISRIFRASHVTARSTSGVRFSIGESQGAQVIFDEVENLLSNGELDDDLAQEQLLDSPLAEALGSVIDKFDLRSQRPFQCEYDNSRPYLDTEFVVYYSQGSQETLSADIRFSMNDGNYAALDIDVDSGIARIVVPGTETVPGQGRSLVETEVTLSDIELMLAKLERYLAWSDRLLELDSLQ